MTIFGVLNHLASHIRRFLSVVLLMVFAITLTPFSAFHNHDEAATTCVEKGESCSHQFHIHAHSEKCLICTIHFEKNYDHVQVQYTLYNEIGVVIKPFPAVSGNFTKLISLGLRGPPVS